MLEKLKKLYSQSLDGKLPPGTDALALADALEKAIGAVAPAKKAEKK